ncbi:hypothetical protein O152_gp316 [Pseudomonas phage PaBG]|uniref:Uncharacterized protein n=1 Tax=Pseudomonas phage PaBG TaxID=1335230 RepID=S5VV86_9CAUD|nr:hypothetical protein O152_gp316 [Pseudomonas phage PaBG]AGS82047.1 hypothetical protein PaBG_00170 [Pseudomonas phage PaBG]
MLAQLLKTARRKWYDFWDYQIVRVWHQDSPGVRVYVSRNWLQRMIYSKEFSHVGERHLEQNQPAS